MLLVRNKYKNKYRWTILMKEDLCTTTKRSAPFIDHQMIFKKAIF